MRLNQVTVSARDLDASIRFYRALGLTLIVRSETRGEHRGTDGALARGATSRVARAGERSPTGSPDIALRRAQLPAQDVRGVRPPAVGKAVLRAAASWRYASGRIDGPRELEFLRRMIPLREPERESL